MKPSSSSFQNSSCRTCSWSLRLSNRLKQIRLRNLDSESLNRDHEVKVKLTRKNRETDYWRNGKEPRCWIRRHDDLILLFGQYWQNNFHWVFFRRGHNKISTFAFMIVLKSHAFFYLNSHTSFRPQIHLKSHLNSTIYYELSKICSCFEGIKTCW